MNKIYRKMVAYDPTTNKVSCIRLLYYDEAIDRKESDAAFYDIYHSSDHQREMIVGITIGGTYLQLSPAAYGTYINETENTMRFVNKNRFLCAVAKYHQEHNLPFDLFDQD